ncbi:MAG: [FeFe] hydrogenase H-cluster radical SAM maturase HydE [Rectinemataceae bacterium]|nr:[FeFe] hydrogenase H-cluster radical SAM maturase HydE [Spirochaetaceae bacterium]
MSTGMLFVQTRDLVPESDEDLRTRADALCRTIHGNRVHVRGLVEVTNYCRQNCLYCGLRRSNGRVRRYRMPEEMVIAMLQKAHARGLRSFVLQGGEDPEYGAERLARLAERIRAALGDEVALAFSFGTFRRHEYARLRQAGVERYLLRFETSDEQLYRMLRGTELAMRLDALEALRALDFEVGSGFMTGLPGHDHERLERDVALARSLDLDMVGVGPFIPHPNTPLGKESCLGLEPALQATAMLRLALPYANMPATTAAGSIAPDGRERMLAAGANVLMPNIGPVDFKKDYEIYPGKICLDEDGLRCIGCLAVRVASIGKELSFGRGDAPSHARRSNGKPDMPLHMPAAAHQEDGA